MSFKSEITTWRGTVQENNWDVPVLIIPFRKIGGQHRISFGINFANAQVGCSGGEYNDSQSTFHNHKLISK